MTKKIFILSFFLFSVSLYSTAQTDSLANLNFELWTSATPEKPYKWACVNYSIPLIGDFITATRTTDSYKDSFALQLETVPSIIPGIPMRGVAASGTLNGFTLKASGGFPLTEKPQVLKGYYKYSPSGNDTASVTVTFTKWNAALSKRDTVGYGEKFFRNQVSTYTLFIVPILFPDGISPDSVLIYISASSPTDAVIGSKLIIDDLEFYGFTGTQNLGIPASNNSISFPNPALSTVTFDLRLIPDAFELTIYSVSGKMVLHSLVRNLIENVDVSSLDEGFYVYTLADKSNTVLSSGKFSVSK